MRVLLFVLGVLALIGLAPMTAVAADESVKGLLLAGSVGQTSAKLTVEIGGVKRRYGQSPYKVNFEALITGGSGKIKSIEWDFGDGNTVSTRMAEHTFTQGDYVVILRVVDENGETASGQMGISAEEDCEC